MKQAANLKTAFSRIALTAMCMLVYLCGLTAAQDKPSPAVPSGMQNANRNGKENIDFATHKDVPPHPLDTPVEGDIPPLSPPLLFVPPKPAEVMSGTKPVENVQMPKAPVQPAESQVKAIDEKFIEVDGPEIILDGPGFVRSDEAEVKPIQSSLPKVDEFDLPEADFESLARKKSQPTPVAASPSQQVPVIDVLADIPQEDLVALENMSDVKDKKDTAKAAEKSVKKMPLVSLENKVPVISVTEDIADLPEMDVGKPKTPVSEVPPTAIPEIPYIPQPGTAASPSGGDIPQIPKLVTPPQTPQKKTVEEKSAQLPEDLPEIE